MREKYKLKLERKAKERHERWIKSKKKKVIIDKGLLVLKSTEDK